MEVENREEIFQECSYGHRDDEASSIDVINGDEEGHSHRKCSVDNCEVDHDSILCLLNSEMMEDNEEERSLESNISRTSVSSLSKHKRVLDYIEMDFDSSENIVHVPLCSDDQRCHSGEVKRTKTAQREKREREVMQKSLKELFATQSNEEIEEEEERYPRRDSPLHGQLTISSSSDDYISLCRSNSTASTQSFVFPILNSNLCETPIKITPCEKRLNKKVSYWRKYCFGCWIF
ncbi:unnamed protein product [Cuscuta campestris]|uniref:Uncharacterized protein n=1 Tax=Cuscuta campestris TaxID=132261 RepID=A0A484LJ40_9ASTE|nr:unnamed protein product [Cuscuta campestris]